MASTKRNFLHNVNMVPANKKKYEISIGARKNFVSSVINSADYFQNMLSNWKKRIRVLAEKLFEDGIVEILIRS